MSSEMLTMKVLRLLRPTSDELREKLDQLASAIRLSLQQLGYEVGEPRILRGQSTSRITVQFKNDVEDFSLLFQGEKFGLVERHVVGYMRGKKSLEPHEKGLLDRLLGILKQNSGPFPVLEIRWRWSWSRLPGLLTYPSEDNPIDVAFDKIVGRTSGPRSTCRIVLLSRDAKCVHLLRMVWSVVPFGPRRLK
jgi:hypothetical protein